MATYLEKLKDPKWQKKRLRIMERDNFRCRDCGDAKSTLQVHHCHYTKGGPWDTPDAYLLTLCEPCHVQRGETEQQIKLLVAELLASTPADALSAMLETHGGCAFYPWRTEAIRWVGAAKNKLRSKQLNQWFERMHEAEANSK